MSDSVTRYHEILEQEEWERNQKSIKREKTPFLKHIFNFFKTYCDGYKPKWIDRSES
jgi:hypothetical protein